MHAKQMVITWETYQYIYTNVCTIDNITVSYIETESRVCVCVVLAVVWFGTIIIVYQVSIVHQNNIVILPYFYIFALSVFCTFLYLRASCTYSTFLLILFFFVFVCEQELVLYLNRVLLLNILRHLYPFNAAINVFCFLCSIFSYFCSLCIY